MAPRRLATAVVGAAAGALMWLPTNLGTTAADSSTAEPASVVWDQPSPTPAATATALPTPAPTAVPTPVPTAVPTPVATVRPAARPAATATPRPVVRSTRVSTAAPAPLVRRNYLLSADGTLAVGVGIYSDCSGQTTVSRTMAQIDTCMTGRTYFVGHNPGVFTPLLHLKVGATITWWDASSQAHVLRVVATRSWSRDAGAPPPVQGDVVAQFQTCITADGSRDLILDTVAG